MASKDLLFLISFLISLLLLSSAGSTRSKYTFLQDASSQISKQRYDYIIIGGGTAGCPLAATLSQNFKVLLLERGGVPYGNPNIERIEYFIDNLAQCNATTPAQAFVSEDGVLNRRARVLGGGTCLNAGFYSRASKEFIEKAGWDPKLVEESYSWVEKVVTFVPELKQWQSAVRKSLLEVGVVPDNGVSYEHLLGTKTGGSIFDNQGNRHTAADLLEYANVNNIDALLHANVHKILFHEKATDPHGRPKVSGVMYTDQTGTRHHAMLNSSPGSEVIISSGALGSPQLLLLSGIGPKEDLANFNIPLVLDAPQVGQGMADNPMNAIFVPSPKRLEVSLVEVVGITSFGSFIESASARNTTALAAPIPATPAVGMLSNFPPRLRSQKLAESRQQELQQLVSSSSDAQDYLSRTGVLMAKVDGPLSTGYLKLKSKNVEDDPIVRFNYFARDEDLNKCIRGIQLIEKMIASPSMADFRYTDINKVPGPMIKLVKFAGSLLPANTSDTLQMGTFCKETVTTIWHYHGGCQVGKVVDHDLRVVGLDNLRVVDGSTFLSSPGTNPQATVMMLGRYMGLKITERRPHK